MSLYFQSLALIENELDMKLNILKVLQHFSKNSGKYHWTKDGFEKLSVVFVETIFQMKEGSCFQINY